MWMKTELCGTQQQRRAQFYASSFAAEPRLHVQRLVQLRVHDKYSSVQVKVAGSRRGLLPQCRQCGRHLRAQRGVVLDQRDV